MYSKIRRNLPLSVLINIRKKVPFIEGYRMFHTLSLQELRFHARLHVLTVSILFLSAHPTPVHGMYPEEVTAYHKTTQKISWKVCLQPMIITGTILLIAYAGYLLNTGCQETEKACTTMSIEVKKLEPTFQLAQEVLTRLDTLLKNCPAAQDILIESVTQTVEKIAQTCCETK
jgi:hypothetical protein